MCKYSKLNLNTFARSAAAQHSGTAGVGTLVSVQQLTLLQVHAARGSIILARAGRWNGRRSHPEVSIAWLETLS